ncbi:laminin subunit gamma-3-like, partial [Rhincodon typus]|uniref:laminin subunit gamma-3-like n=1 Tax=Rhincodon typus TaxID=259920 RepID=UPI00202DFE26
CACHPIGSTNQLQTCDPGSGQCECLPHVIGRDCSQCEPGYYNLQPTVGCLSCACHPLGSRNSFCQSRTGQCNCRPGIEGRSCDRCQRGYFDLSERGCQACDCSPLGSVGMQCLGNGSCVCKTGFVGRRCEQCQENYYYEALTFHCQLCPTCYSLVQLEVCSGAHFVGLVGEIEMALARIEQELSNISHSLDCEGSEHKRCIVVAA